MAVYNGGPQKQLQQNGRDRKRTDSSEDSKEKTSKYLKPDNTDSNQVTISSLMGRQLQLDAIRAIQSGDMPTLAPTSRISPPKRIQKRTTSESSDDEPVRLPVFNLPNNNYQTNNNVTENNIQSNNKTTGNSIFTVFGNKPGPPQRTPRRR